MLHIVLWKWQQPGFSHVYEAQHVNVMVAMLRRNIDARNLPYRIVTVTDDHAGITSKTDIFPFWDDFRDMQSVMGEGMPSCYRRLKMFDPDTQREMGIKRGDQIVWIDLDTVITGPLNPVLERTDSFLGWSVRGTYHLRVFNGSMIGLTAGEHVDIWRDFDPHQSPFVAKTAGFLGSDQGWLSYKLAENPNFKGWTWPQVSSYPRELIKRTQLPHGCAVAFFHGRRKPWHPDVFNTTEWIAKNWRL